MKKILVWLVGSVVVFATCWALLNPGFFRVHDYVHGARISEMLRALQQGQFPVRWSENLGYGYGMPLFEFYAPLPYYVGAFFYWIGFDLVTSIKIIYLIAGIGTFVGMYRFGTRLFGRAGALVAAAAFTLAPYRAVNLYVRGAVSEAWAMMALPWVCLGVLRVVRREKGGWVTLVGGLVTLFLSHNITTMLFFPVVLGLGAVLMLHTFLTEPRRRKVLEVMKSVSRFAWPCALAVGLAAFYIFPALVEKDATKIGLIFGGYFHYANHFLYIRQFFTANWGYQGSVFGPEDGMSFFLGYGQVIGAAAALLLTLFHLWRRRRTSRQLWLISFFALTMLVAAYMTLLKSKPIWDAIPTLLVVQFPWRFLSIMTLCVAVLAGYSVTLISRKIWRNLWVISLITVMVLGNWNFFRPESFLTQPDDFYYSDPQRIRTNMSSILPDYIPIQMSEILEPPAAPYVVSHGAESQVETVINDGHQKLFRTNFTSPVFLNVMIADFPGWRVELDGKDVTDQKSIGIRGTFGLTVPAGTHQVGVYFGKTPIRFWSDLASAVSVIILLAALLQTTYHRERTFYET